MAKPVLTAPHFTMRKPLLPMSKLTCGRKGQFARIAACHGDRLAA